MADNYYEMLNADVRFIEGLNACINCGTCTAICPAAEFYKYDPRIIAVTVQTKDNLEIEKLLSGETIWYCGECLSCKTRCPRNNTPGYIIQALRHLSHLTGLFTRSEKGRQSLAIKRTVGDEMLLSGYCMHVDRISAVLHPEQGPVWDWVRENPAETIGRCGGNVHGAGAGALREIPEDALAELRNIFYVTGGLDYYENIERHSELKAREMGLGFDRSLNCNYFRHVYCHNNGRHQTESLTAD